MADLFDCSCPKTSVPSSHHALWGPENLLPSFHRVHTQTSTKLHLPSWKASIIRTAGEYCTETSTSSYNLSSRWTRAARMERGHRLPTPQGKREN
jgi:hypothetical protein